MLAMRLNRDNPERVFIVCKNGYSTASLTNGQAVGWDLGTSTGLGVEVTKPTADKSFAFAGVVAETIAAGDYGLVQIYGYHSAGIVYAKATTASIIKTGTPLVSIEAEFALRCVSNTQSAIEPAYPCAFAMEAYSATSTTTKKIFIKAM